MVGIKGRDYQDTWKVAATFVGTIVGAGFASGQEILKFFSHFGVSGLMGIGVSCGLFCITGITTMLLGQKLQAVSFREVVRHVCGPRFGPAVDLILSLFLFGSLSVMLAGAGAVLLQQWGLPVLLGTVLTVMFSIATVFYGISGIIRANSLVVPLMLAVCLAVTLPALSIPRLAALNSTFQPVGRGASFHWIMSALLYVSYNLGLSVSVLAPLGREIKNKPPLIWGGLLGGLVLSGLALVIDLAILCHYPASADYDIPSLFVAGQLAPLLQLSFSFILWAEIFTTVIGTVFGLAARITQATALDYRMISIALIGAAAFISRFGFAGLVGTLYPLFGYVSLVFLTALLAFPFFNRK